MDSQIPCQYKKKKKTGEKKNKVFEKCRYLILKYNRYYHEAHEAHEEINLSVTN